MGTLIPNDFDLESLERAERLVVDSLLDKTDPEWLILPHIPYVQDGQDGEVDVLAVHPNHGGVVIEVKGGVIAVKNGTWTQNGDRMSKSPMEQANQGKHCLIKKIDSVTEEDGVSPVRLEHAVAFPDAASIPDGSLGPDGEPRMVLTSRELQWPEKALVELRPARDRRASENAMRSMLRALRPDLEFETFSGEELTVTARKLDAQTENMLTTAEGLDANKRVWVEGPAGSGKSRLAIRWATRASARGERVLLTCYNKPMGSIFARLFEHDDRVVAGTFHELAEEMLAPFGVEFPKENAPKEFWENDVPEALWDHIDNLEKFDTIIIDEGQDFRSHWYTAVEGLLDPDGTDKMFRLGDPSQNVYRIDPHSTTAWTTFPLTVNCRNTKAIAEVGKRLGGANTFESSPEGKPVRFIVAPAVKEVLKKINREVARMRREHGLPLSSIAVITTRAAVRDQILDGAGDSPRLVRWDERDENAVVCENAHRLKGTEWQAVIAVNLEPVTTEWLPGVLYVAITRPTTLLTVIGLAETGELLGLEPESATAQPES